MLIKQSSQNSAESCTETGGEIHSQKLEREHPQARTEQEKGQLLRTMLLILSLAPLSIRPLRQLLSTCSSACYGLLQT